MCNYNSLSFPFEDAALVSMFVETCRKKQLAKPLRAIFDEALFGTDDQPMELREQLYSLNQMIYFFEYLERTAEPDGFCDTDYFQDFTSTTNATKQCNVLEHLILDDELADDLIQVYNHAVYDYSHTAASPLSESYKKMVDFIIFVREMRVFLTMRKTFIPKTTTEQSKTAQK